MFSNLEDHQLVNLYIKGDESVLEILVNRHKDKLYNYIYNVVRIEALAEDIFQDTFFKVIRTIKKGQYNEEGKFFPWVARIAHNLIIDHYRRETKFPMMEQSEEFDIFSIIKTKSNSHEDDLFKYQVKKDLRKLLLELPHEQREVLIMRMYHDMSFKEISDMTNVSINTALGRMRYALINLRKLIEEKKMVLS